MTGQPFTWTTRALHAWLEAQAAALNLDVVPGPVAEAEPIPPRLHPAEQDYLAKPQKIGYFMPVSQAVLRETEEFWAGIAANEARRAALTPAQRAAEDAEWAARLAAEKAERTCEHCGCDPDEHGGC